MTMYEFEKLKPGDHVEFLRGPDAGKLMDVIYIEDYHNICLRVMYDEKFAPVQSNSNRNNVKLKITTGVGIIKVE